MTVVIMIGSTGLVASEVDKFFAGLGMDVMGIDNDMRRLFFGEEASTLWKRKRLECQLGQKYRHVDADIRNFETMSELFAFYGSSIELVIHEASQHSHDWASRDSRTDFNVNAIGTLNLLEAARDHCPETPFIYTYTNKVYSDTPNQLPLVELEQRWEIESVHTYARSFARIVHSYSSISD